MSLMTILLILWGGLLAAFLLLMVYRGTLSMHEDDQVFLHDEKSAQQTEQEEILDKLRRLQPYVWGLGGLSGMLTVIIAGMLIYDGIKRL